MQIPRLLRPFLKPTADEKTPTDSQLDNDIEYATALIHNTWPVLKSIMRNKVRRFFRYRWKFALGRLVITVMILVPSYFAFVKVFSMRIVHVGAVQYRQVDECLSYKHDSSMNLRNYLLQRIYAESRYNKAARRPGSEYWGLYALGNDARRIAGYGDISYEVFIKHPEIQDLAMIELLKYQKKYMQPYIDKYNGKIIDGILVTESGILALCGIGCDGAKGYLDAGVIPPVDEHGNPLRALLKLGGYDLRLDQVKYSIQDAVTGKQTIK